ncbi:MAG: hypothetical protein DRI57_03000 [Deltaproteobacteria bacterium]|nr:MAG: hypothetical protein DRI57_03000 [Deltaproteobacteria bacterium]
MSPVIKKQEKFPGFPAVGGVSNLKFESTAGRGLQPKFESTAGRGCKPSETFVAGVSRTLRTGLQTPSGSSFRQFIQAVHSGSSFRQFIQAVHVPA